MILSKAYFLMATMKVNHAMSDLLFANLVDSQQTKFTLPIAIIWYIRFDQ